MTKSTGWVKPGGKFAPLDCSTHEDWLEANTDIHDNTGADVRLLALNRGYARSRQYGGKLTIEVNVTYFRGALKRALGVLLEDHADNIDFVTVQLVNNKGLLVRSASAQVFDAECTTTAALSVLEKLS
jgi:hypothetical protein